MWQARIKKTHWAFVKIKNYDAIDMIKQQQQIMKEEEEAEVSIPLKKYIELKQAKIQLDKLLKRKKL